MDNNLTKARAYFYEFLAYPLFFHEHGGKFDRWREQLAYLATSPVTPQSEAAFANLAKFDFEKFAREQNDVLFDFSYSNIPLNASFYEDGRDDGAARLRVIECLKLSPYRRDKEVCKDSEDYVGFIFLATATFLRDKIATETDKINNWYITINGYNARYAQADTGIQKEYIDYFQRDFTLTPSQTWLPWTSTVRKITDQNMYLSDKKSGKDTTANPKLYDAVCALAESISGTSFARPEEF